MAATPHVLFAGGGSASHLFPGMAVAEHLRIPPNAGTFAGTGAARERHTVRIAGHHYSTIPTHPMPRNPLQAVRFVTDNVAGYCAARWMLREQRVSLVVGLGGSTSVAVVRAAVARGSRRAVEQNAPGRTTGGSRAAMAQWRLRKFPHLHVQALVTVTGNPCRTVFEDLYKRTAGQAASVRRTRVRPAPFMALPRVRSANTLDPRRLLGLARSTNPFAALQAVWRSPARLADCPPDRRRPIAGDRGRYAKLGMKRPCTSTRSPGAICERRRRVRAARRWRNPLAGVPRLVLFLGGRHQTANAKVYTAASRAAWSTKRSKRGLDAALNSNR
jgi:hypothetical protein